MQPQQPSSLDSYLDNLKSYLSDQRIHYTIESFKRSLRDLYSAYDIASSNIQSIPSSLYWWYNGSIQLPIAYKSDIMDDKDVINWKSLMEDDRKDNDDEKERPK